MSNVLSDEHLVSRAVGGHKPSFSLLVARHQSTLRVMLRNLCQRPDIADDLAQQSFIAAWIKLAQFDGQNFKGWLCRIAFREFLMWKRKRKDDELTDDDILSPNSNQLDKLTLEQALKQLSQGQREVLTLSYFVGLSHSEIEDITGIPLGTVKSHAKRGMEQLRQLLGESHDERR